MIRRERKQKKQTNKKDIKKKKRTTKRRGNETIKLSDFFRIEETTSKRDMERRYANRRSVAMPLALSLRHEAI